MVSSLPQTLDDWLAYIERQHPKSIEMGLERVRAVADALGLARPAAQVITVGGTNGKGSTVAFIESIARAAGRASPSASATARTRSRPISMDFGCWRSM